MGIRDRLFCNNCPGISGTSANSSARFPGKRICSCHAANNPSQGDRPEREASIISSESELSFPVSLMVTTHPPLFGITTEITEGLHRGHRDFFGFSMGEKLFRKPAYS